MKKGVGVLFSLTNLITFFNYRPIIQLQIVHSELTTYQEAKYPFSFLLKRKISIDLKIWE